MFFISPKKIATVSVLAIGASYLSTEGSKYLPHFSQASFEISSTDKVDSKKVLALADQFERSGIASKEVCDIFRTLAAPDVSSKTVGKAFQVILKSADLEDPLELLRKNAEVQRNPVAELGFRKLSAGDLDLSAEESEQASIVIKSVHRKMLLVAGGASLVTLGMGLILLGYVDSRKSAFNFWDSKIVGSATGTMTLGILLFLGGRYLNSSIPTDSEKEKVISILQSLPTGMIKSEEKS